MARERPRSGSAIVQRLRISQALQAAAGKCTTEPRLRMRTRSPAGHSTSLRLSRMVKSSLVNRPALRDGHGFARMAMPRRRSEVMCVLER